MSNNKNFEVIAIEDYGERCIKDEKRINSIHHKPQGFVEIYEKDEKGMKKLIGKCNLVVYSGREHLAQRLLNIQNSNISIDKDCFLGWIGFGDGGVDLADPLNPLPVSSLDTGLTNEIPFSSVNSTGYGDLRSGYYYKKNIEDGQIDFEQDSANDNKWLIAKITRTLEISECNGYQISEAALFNAASKSTGYSPGEDSFFLYAKITFPPITKIVAINRSITFVWYIYM